MYASPHDAQAITERTQIRRGVHFRHDAAYDLVISEITWLIIRDSQCRRLFTNKLPTPAKQQRPPNHHLPRASPISP